MKMWRLRQEWGGTLEQLKEYVESAEHTQLPEEERKKMQAGYLEAKAHWLAYFEDDTQRALKFYQDSLSIKPTSETLSRYGMALLHTDQIDEAIDVLKQSIVLDPNNDSAKTSYAQALLIKHPRSFKIYREATRLLEEATKWNEWHSVQVYKSFKDSLSASENTGVWGLIKKIRWWHFWIAAAIIFLLDYLGII
jgi:tetratricopeptide (TPR) repeat protein